MPPNANSFRPAKFHTNHPSPLLIKEGNQLQAPLLFEEGPGAVPVGHRPYSLLLDAARLTS
jgi:hypothetical protein